MLIITAGRAQNWLLAALRTGFAALPEAWKTGIYLENSENLFLSHCDWPDSVGSLLAECHNERHYR
jgi:hypothetical protein